jgi:xanthine dehydrogenase accessory factor
MKYMNILDKAAELAASRTPFAMATVVSAKGSTPRSTASKMIIFKDGSIYDTIGGGIVEACVIEEAAAALKEGKPRMVNYRLNSDVQGGLPMHCGGDMDVFIDVFNNVPHVVIVGGGHVGYALSKVVAFLQWDCSVIEERAEFNQSERFPHARKIYKSGDKQSLSEVAYDDTTYVVIVTKDHDKECLKQVAMTEAGYIGMIGSRRKMTIVFKELVEEGIPEERLDIVHAPVGLDIGAETPEEIALSIAAEMLKVSKQGSGKSLNEMG